jgi:hypothetical protein
MILKNKINDALVEKLDYFLKTKKIPNIIFHGASGSGKRTIVNKFLLDIYNGDKLKLKSNIMIVDCTQGKGIKFIREELKFFAKTNIHYNDNDNVMFKSIVLLNADSLTIDAQSALRRCIELFSYNTRFFIVVENKHKLLNPILSRFCEINISENTDCDGKLINFHKYNIDNKINNLQINHNINIKLENKMRQCAILGKNSLPNIIKFSIELYEDGFCAKNIIDNLFDFDLDIEIDKDILVLFYYKIKDEFRCEKLLFFYILKFLYFEPTSSNETLKNMLLI